MCNLNLQSDRQVPEESAQLSIGKLFLLDTLTRILANKRRTLVQTPGFVTYPYSLEKFAGALSCQKCRSGPLPPDLRSEKFLLLSDQGYTGLSLVTGAPIPKRLKMMRKGGIWV
jgi:hypothetical protein